MGRFRRFRKIGREWLAAALGMAALGIAVGVYVRATRPPTYRLKITAGSPQGLRHQIAVRLASEAAKRRAQLSLETTSGSEEALDQVDAGRLDLALVQGGLGPGRRRRLRQVAALHVEPLHLLVKEEIYPEVSRGLEALRGKSVNLSEIGSGTYRLASSVLAFAGLSPRTRDGAGDYEVRTLSYRELEDETDRAKLPDAAFMVSALPSPIARHLVARRRYRLVPLSFGEAFSLDVLNVEMAPSPSPRSWGDVDKVHVAMTQIPPFTYGVDPPVPPDPASTLGTRLLLVANAGVDPRAVRRVLEVVFSPQFAQLARPPLDPKLLGSPPEMEWHPGTLQYLERNKPLIAGDAIDFLEKGTSLTGALLGGLFFLWQWAKQHYRRRRELGFEAYMVKVATIERQALELETGAMLDLRELLRLQAELSQLKNEALRKFAEGELEGEALITGFVSHVNDARNYLTRLILHERESLEKQARHEKRSPEALWNEALGESPGPVADARDGARPAPMEDFGP